MNAVHDLPVLVARDEGFFRDEGLDIEFVTTPGMAQVTTSHSVRFDSVFDRPARLGLQRRRHRPVSHVRMGNHETRRRGRLRRTPRAEDRGLRRLHVEVRHRRCRRLQCLRARDAEGQGDCGDAEQRLPLHDAEDDGRLSDAGARQRRPTPASMPQRIEALRQGKVAAVSLMEPWISVAQKQGLRISDRVTLDPQRGCRRRPRRLDARGDVSGAGEGGRSSRTGSRHLISTTLSRRTGGLLEPHELQTWRLLHAAPQPYTRERFDDTYNWTVKWNMVVPGPPMRRSSTTAPGSSALQFSLVEDANRSSRRRVTTSNPRPQNPVSSQALRVVSLVPTGPTPRAFRGLGHDVRFGLAARNP